MNTPATVTTSPPPAVVLESDASKLGGRRAAMLISALLLGVLSFQLNASMVTPALPHIAASFGLSADSAAPVQSMFFLAGAIAGPVIGRWSDFIGRRFALLLVLAIMGAGTILCVAAPTLPILIAGRFLQGVSSAVFALAYIVLSENLNARVFGTSVGIIAAINGGIGGVDGYFGGLMSETLGFRSIFVVVLILTAIAAACILKTVPKGLPQGIRGAMDWWGAGSLSVFLVFITYFVSDGSAAGWTAPSTLGLLAGTIASFVAFWMIEKRRRHPLIAVHHLRSRQVWPVIATTVLTLAGIFAIINFTVVLLSQDMHAGFGLSASLSALLFLTPAALIGVFAAPLAGWLADRRGWIKTLRAGTALTLASAIVAAAFSGNQVAVLIAVASLGIFYNGLFLTAINGLSVLLSPKEAPAALPGINGASFGIGASLGVVIVAPFAAQATSVGYATALWISVAITAVAFIVSLFVAAPKGETL
ncbi:MFS transporter [Arthrobacter bambusae]|uniref:MFS transporter n=1 Tax=Arthrobacter bambusae TaxID=1338426 RepID=UPI002789C494|nr:MFS transporter [Arthrobacter bambusae]MDQ0029680.1 putative MFS family arabinose efflux permease [Arthrobacter bambusae]MDQ0097341.1 putative MFS family arabinose efflux permease [Arthrobacter bambusae]